MTRRTSLVLAALGPCSLTSTTLLKAHAVLLTHMYSSNFRACFTLPHSGNRTHTPGVTVALPLCYMRLLGFGLLVKSAPGAILELFFWFMAF